MSSYDAQIVNHDVEIALCNVCGTNLVVLGNFFYESKDINKPRYRDEICTCRNCGRRFVMRYQYFNNEGHIKSFLFCEDPNDPDYDWADQLSPEQKSEIKSHLEKCQRCTSALVSEQLSDAWFASLLHEHRSKSKKH